MTTLITIIQDGGGSRCTMSELEPKRAQCNEGTPRRHRRTQGRQLAVTDGEGCSSPRFQARPVSLRMVKLKDTPVRRAMKRIEVSTSTSISAAGTFYFKFCYVIWIVTELKFHAPSPPSAAHKLLIIFTVNCDG